MNIAVPDTIELSAAAGQLGALAEPTRLNIYRYLVCQAPAGVCVGDLLPEIGLTQPTLSFHLKALLVAGLVTRSKHGRYVFYRPEFSAMHDLMQFLTDNCCRNDVIFEPLGRSDTGSNQ